MLDVHIELENAAAQYAVIVCFDIQVLQQACVSVQSC